MKRTRVILDEHGFTIQELLVVLIVASLLIGFVLSLFLFVNKQVSSWQLNLEMRRSVNGVLQTVVLDFQRSADVRVLSDSTLVLEREPGRSVVYRFGPDTVWRNGDPFFAESGLKLGGNVTVIRSGTALSALEDRYEIQLTGTWREKRYVAACQVAVPGSSKHQFTTYNDRRNKP